MAAWSLVTHIVYFFISALVTWRKDEEEASWNVAALVQTRDRMFAVNLTLAASVALFFLCILLPLTPGFTNVSSSCKLSDDNCITPHAFVVLVLSNLTPFFCMALDAYYVDHKFAYRNTYVELGALIAIILIYLFWSIVCAALNEDWPYNVQSDVSDNIPLSVTLNIILVTVFIALYFLSRAVIRRLQSSRKPQGRLTETLLENLDDAWNVQAPVQEYDVTVYDSEEPAEQHGAPAGATGSIQRG
jgi:ABC-type multidrug transport system fused ATPase/permease subunit